MGVDRNLRWHVQNIPFVLIRLARLRIPHGPKHVFFYLHKTYIGTGRTTTSSLVLFRSLPWLRHALAKRSPRIRSKRCANATLFTYGIGRLKVHLCSACRQHSRAVIKAEETSIRKTNKTEPDRTDRNGMAPVRTK